MVDKHMCSRNCPCVAVSPNPWVTGATATSTPRNLVSFDFTGTMTNYKTCLTTPVATADSCFKSFAANVVANKNWGNISSMLTFFESTYSCSGVCTASQFAFSKPVSDGKPKQSCAAGLKSAMGEEFRGLAIIALISGCLLFIIFIFQYCLWKKY